MDIHHKQDALRFFYLPNQCQRAELAVHHLRANVAACILMIYKTIVLSVYTVCVLQGARLVGGEGCRSSFAQ